MRDNYLMPVRTKKCPETGRGTGQPKKALIIDDNDCASQDERMENRVRELEKTAAEVRERLVRIETNLAHVATETSVEKIAGDLKATIESVRADLIKWFMATALVLAGLALAAARYTH